MAKPILGFATKKECTAAIQKIVHQYPAYVEFFDPLLQRLFIEHPYWCDPPGFTFTKFMWIKYTLPTGATTDRWFTAYSDETGWIGPSWKKAIKGDRRTIKDKLHDEARNCVTVIVDQYRLANPRCQFYGCRRRSEHVHHTVPMQQIFEETLALLSPQELAEYEKHYVPCSIEMFSLPRDSKFIQHVISRHGPGSMLALCVDHHYEIEGKQRRK